MSAGTKNPLDVIYQRLLRHFGPQEWWPARTRFEVIVGAILTQNTNWGNVELAINRLKAQKLLTPKSLRETPTKRLAQLIKPSGYFNIKAKRLKNFVSFLYKEYNGDLLRMATDDVTELRQKLLSVNGVGPETADSILLYAFQKPVFVIDAYTKRILVRHNIVGYDADYHQLQRLFMGSIRRDTKMYNEYHALIVKLGKDYCKPNPLCERCILKDYKYSTVNKCSRCHRALPKADERAKSDSGMVCTACRAYLMR